MKYLDSLLNQITMYRLLVYGLGFLAACGIFFALLGRLAFSPTGMILSLVTILVAAYAGDRLFAWLWRAPSNQESWLITALILFLLLPPAREGYEFIALGLAGFISSISKFIIAWHGKHLFNPAAFAAVVVGLTTLLTPTWWIGSAVFWPLTLLFGLAVVRKIRRFGLVLTFVLVSAFLQLVIFSVHNQPLGAGMQHALLASPLIFLATIMLTEPATMPPRRNQQLIFGAGIAVLYVLAWKVGPVYIYPEVALLLGNLYAFIVSPKLRVEMVLQRIERISDRVYNYVFRPSQPLHYLAGQYMEWTLPGVAYDSRGNRRTFTLASSPTEKEVHLGVKYYQSPSAYKASLAHLVPGQSVYASQLAGNFTLNGHEQHKLAFIAGGIGITPFRSMVKYLADTQSTCDVVLLYFVTDASELAYVSTFREAAARGVRLIPIVSEATTARGLVTGRLSPELLARLIPDGHERIFFVSGPNAMVDTAKHYLRQLGVKRSAIKTDHFSGY